MNLSRLTETLESLSQEERDHFLLDSLCYGDILTIKIAILTGGNLSMYSNYPLRRAIERNWPEIVQLLIEEGVDVKKNDNEAIKLAHQYEREDIIKILEKAGAHL